MIVYLASPNTQQQAEHAAGMPVLLSFASTDPWLERYQASFKRVLIDSGAYGELNGTAAVDIGEYREWSTRWLKHADAIAGLDDIRGDWRRSMANYAAIPWSFPTFHDTDPPELLAELIAMARERSRWLAIGLKPPRQGKEAFVRRTCEQIPDDIHVHGWALRAYTRIRRIDTVDSTNWWRDGMQLAKELPWLTFGECLDLVVKRYERWDRELSEASAQSHFDF